MYGKTLIAGKPSHDKVISASIIIFFRRSLTRRASASTVTVPATLVRRFTEFRLPPSVDLPLALPGILRFFDKIVYSPFYFQSCKF